MLEGLRQNDSVGNERNNSGDGRHIDPNGTVARPCEQHETGIPVTKRQRENEEQKKTSSLDLRLLVQCEVLKVVKNMTTAKPARAAYLENQQGQTDNHRD